MAVVDHPSVTLTQKKVADAIRKPIFNRGMVILNPVVTNGMNNVSSLKTINERI